LNGPGPLAGVWSGRFERRLWANHRGNQALEQAAGRELTLCPLRRHPIVFRDTGIPGPISREFRHDAVGTPISGHDVSGAGWQTPGRVTQPITTMMPA
jgi:hypothetical protein